MVRSPAHVPFDISENYEVIEWNHACSILIKDFPDEWLDLLAVLRGFKLLQSSVDARGGGLSNISKVIDDAFRKRGWFPKEFKTQVKIDETVHDSPTHKVDNVKGRVAEETEWNNKTEFYDRDLNNFRLLHQLGVISVGIVITRCDELQEIFDALGKGDSYGATTTILSKLVRKLEGGGAGGCPVLVFGISKKLYVEDMDASTIAASIEERNIARQLKKNSKKSK